MRLTRLRLEQFKQFRKPIEINDLEDGINLFVGPNESGKSTLAQAIRAAFFERHKSSSVDDLQPWGDSGASPEVELDFEWQGTRWILKKRFLKSKRCDLQMGQDEFNGDDAEDKLSELLGYTFAGRGASKAEHWGIPGLLWVEQGAVQQIQEPVGHAGDHLKSALGSTLSEVTSSSGDELIARVERERGQLLTKTGQPRADYKTAIEQCDVCREELEGLDQRINEYRQQVDRLGQLRQQQLDIDAARPWEEFHDKAQQARVRLDEVRSWQQEQSREQRELENCERQQALYREQLDGFSRQEEQLRKRAEEKEAAAQAHEQCRERKPQLDEKLATAQREYETANEVFKQARQQAARDALQKEYNQLDSSVAERKTALENAREIQKQLQQLRERQQETAIDGDALEELSELESELNNVRIQQRAVATRVEYELDTGKTLDIGGEAVSGAGERLLLDATNLDIPEIGRLRLHPGGTDVAELLREQKRLEANRAELLKLLGIESLPEGERRASDNRDLNQAMDQNRIRLEAIAPNGVEELGGQCRLDEQRLAKLAAQLSELPEDRPNLPSEQDAESVLESARATLRAVEEVYSEYRRELQLAEHALEVAESEWERLNKELKAPNRKAREEEAAKELTSLRAQETELRAGLEQRQKKIDAANPDALEQDLARFNRTAQAMESEARSREGEIAGLQARLEALGAQGLEEERNGIRQEAERQERRCHELERRAHALTLLLDLLREQRQALTRQLQAPLQNHLNHYLNLLFPGASLSVNEDLMPETITRPLGTGDERGAVEELSFGAREQMGLISRLAYADLLQEAGRPTLIILDDALVHCDADRLDQMKRIVFDAAQRHQILLFTCHPERWRDLGVVFRDMQGLSATAG